MVLCHYPPDLFRVSLSVAIDVAGFIPGIGLVAKAGRAGKGVRAYGHAAREFVTTPKDIYNLARHPLKTTAPIGQSVVHGGKVLADPHTIPHSALIGQHNTVKIGVGNLGVDPSSVPGGKHVIGVGEEASLRAKEAVDAATMKAARGESGAVTLPTGERLTIDPVPISQVKGGALVHATPMGSVFDKDLVVQGSEGGCSCA